ILDGFKIDDAKIEAALNNDVVEIDIQTESIGIIIGHRGETLDAIQYLISLAIKRTTDTYVRVIVNVGNYRDKREKTLKALAEKNANYVLKTGRRYGFEPMNPYERRIIHTTVQEIEGVTSRSVGSGVDRRVLIEPVGGVRDNGGHRRNNRAPKALVAADPNREKRVDRADIPKFGKIEVNKD
ncbi:MAG: KH domain-containing protein, partial [Eubacterium sp.]|nr:KH domain-containing protein [Eubacterium sp.]